MTEKTIYWVGNSKDKLLEFPKSVVRDVGYALHLAQIGEKATYAKPLKGFSGAGVLEIVEDFNGDTYRAIYTVKFSDAVYVLHSFQKKSKQGIKTPKHEIDLIKERLNFAQEHYKKRGIQ